ncbi:MAG: histidine kinase [Prevotellaceae bacterium]|jgi:sensor histidine kinase YesM|nr:histidine kinase [Prevotellaceae bacterium]
MKRSQVILGILVSLGMAVLFTVPQILEPNNVRWGAPFVKPGSVLLSSLILWVGNGWLIYHKGYNRLIKNGVWKSILAVFLTAFIANLLCFHLLPRALELCYPADFLRSDFKHPLPKFFGTLFQSIMFYYILLFQKLMEEKKNSQIEIQKLQQAQMEAKIASLKEQLSPHFLFNTLNILSSLTKEKEAQDFIQEMAKVYRYVLQYKNNDTATLAEELQFLQSYWYVLTMRFEDSIGLTVAIEERHLHTAIPPLTLQILIENVIKHNMASAEKPLAVHIYSDDETITVENNYQSKRIVENTGEGLKNIGQRYKLLFGKDICVHHDGVRFRVMLPIIEQVAQN